MCLWDALLNSDEHSAHCRTESHRDAANPLRRDGQLAAVHLIEYGAQAMAVHGGWMARQNRAAGDGAGARPGVLAAVRQFEVYVARLDDLAAPLECPEIGRASCRESEWQYV